MELKVYIFNCSGTIDLPHAAKLHQNVSAITGMICDTYTCVFRLPSSELWTRTGTTKNIEKNIQKYLLLSKYAISEFHLLETYDKPKNDPSWWTVDLTTYFLVEPERFEKGIFKIYVVLPYSLDNNQILELWNLFSSLYNTKYMVHFALDSKKNVEIFMTGTAMITITPTTPSITEEEFFSPQELQVLRKLQDLRRLKTYDLGDVFPLCIVTKDFSVVEQSYQSKTNIGLDTYLFSK